MADIRGPKPLFDLAPEAWGLAFCLGSALVLLLLLFLFLFLKRKKTLPPAQPKRAPSLRARLDHLKNQLEQGSISPEAFCAGLSEAVREYVRGQWGIPCRRLTTLEILSELEGKGASPNRLAAIGTLLEACDLVKFAELTPAAIELHASLTSAYLILEGLPR